MEEKIKSLEKLISESISIKWEEKEKVFNYAKNNPDKIDEIISIFEKERMENIKSIINYIS